MNDTLVVHGFSDSYKLRLCVEDIAHNQNGFFLGGGDNMGVGVKSKSCGEVTEPTTDHLNIYAIL